MGITKSDIQSLATDKSYDRGYDYYEEGYVENMKKRGNVISAEVEGSEYDLYQVQIKLNESGIESTSCSCPYDWGGICKHIVATFLNYVNDPEAFVELPSVETLLSGLNEDALRKILIQLLDNRPSLIEKVEKEVVTLEKVLDNLPSSAAKTSSMDPPKHPKKSINTAAITRQTQKLFRHIDYEDYYYDDGYDYEIAQGLSDLLKQIPPLLEANDGASALLVLDAVLDTFIEESLDCEYDEILDELSSDAIPFLTEALLMTDFSEQERRLWEEKLETWDGDVYEYGYGDLFAAPHAAIEQGWEDPLLVAILQGDEKQQGLWGDDPPEYAYDLTKARLNVLKRQGRLQELLHLAKAEGHVLSYLTVLVEQGRYEETVSYALEHGLEVGDIEGIPQALYDKGQWDEAFKIAEYGLTLYGSSSQLARWLRDNAIEASQKDLALKAAQAAFEESKELQDYKVLATLAGSEWDSLKLEMLERVKETHFKNNLIDIYLYEKMHKELVELIDQGGYWGSSKLVDVIDAVYKDFPEWAIEQCKKQAEPNMDAGKSKYYQQSVRWVERAGKIYLFAGKVDAWHDYIEGLIEQHIRKYTLRPQLESLRRLKHPKGEKIH